VRPAIWHGWVFVNIDGQAQPFEDYMAPAMKAYVDWDLGALKLVHYQPFDFHAAWKLVIETFCDTYHVFMVASRSSCRADAGRLFHDAAR